MKNKNRLKKNALLEKEVETAKTANTRNLNSAKKLFSGGSSYFCTPFLRRSHLTCLLRSCEGKTFCYAQCVWIVIWVCIVKCKRPKDRMSNDHIHIGFDFHERGEPIIASCHDEITRSIHWLLEGNHLELNLEFIVIWCPSNQLHTVDKIAEIVFDSKCCLFKGCLFETLYGAGDIQFNWIESGKIPCIERQLFSLGLQIYETQFMSIVADKRMDDSLACKSMVCNDHWRQNMIWNLSFTWSSRLNA